MKNKTKAMAVGAGVLILGGVGTTAVMASAGGAASDTERERAERIAVDHIGEGTASGFEFGDEEGAYEVEVRRGDGSEVDVHLDEAFTVISTEDETGDETGDDGAGDDD